MINKYQKGIIGDLPQHSHDITPYKEAMDNLRFDKALAEVWLLVRGLNQLIEEEKPWSSAQRQARRRAPSGRSAAACRHRPSTNRHAPHAIYAFHG